MEAIGRTERLTNLVLLLLETRNPLTMTQICDAVAGYPPESKAAARRQAFERDKKALREVGIPITIQPAPDQAQVGYAISKDEYYLPDPGFTEEETAALSIAVSGVHIGDTSGENALSKLGLGVGDLRHAVAVLPSVPNLGILYSAVAENALVEFDYGDVHRIVEPFALLFRGGAWYLIGCDRVRASRRTFRADRIESEVVKGLGGAFEVPADFDPQSEMPNEPWKIGGGEATRVSIWLDGQIAPSTLAELGAEVADSASRLVDGGAIIELEVVSEHALMGWLLSKGHHAKVIGPPDVVEMVKEWLTGLMAQSE